MLSRFSDGVVSTTYFEEVHYIVDDKGILHDLNAGPDGVLHLAWAERFISPNRPVFLLRLVRSTDGYSWHNKPALEFFGKEFVDGDSFRITSSKRTVSVISHSSTLGGFYVNLSADNAQSWSGPVFKPFSNLILHANRSDPGISKMIEEGFEEVFADEHGRFIVHVYDRLKDSDISASVSFLLVSRNGGSHWVRYIPPQVIGSQDSSSILEEIVIDRATSDVYKIRRGDDKVWRIYAYSADEWTEVGIAPFQKFVPGVTKLVVNRSVFTIFGSTDRCSFKIDKGSNLNYPVSSESLSFSSSSNGRDWSRPTRLQKVINYRRDSAPDKPIFQVSVAQDGKIIVLLQSVTRDKNNSVVGQAFQAII